MLHEEYIEAINKHVTDSEGFVARMRFEIAGVGKLELQSTAG
jgi:hypothetical protein